MVYETKCYEQRCDKKWKEIKTFLNTSCLPPVMKILLSL